MNTRIYLNGLDANSVTLIKQNYVTVEGAEYNAGQPAAVSYINSTNGRAEVESDVIDPYKTAIFAVWGDTPTVDENSVD